MADTNTPNYNFVLVEIGASRDTWGGKTNANMTSIDANLKTLANSIATNTTNIANNTTAITNTNNAFKAWMPIGIVCLWTVNGTPPAGWAICDGRTVTRTDGGGNLTTPNMMARFILADANPGQVGGNYTGSAAFTTAAAGQHSHGGATQDHVLTIAEMPSHTHGGAVGMTGSQNTGGNAAHTPRQQTDATGGNAGHGHGIWADGNHQHSVTVTLTIVPNYFTAIYIMRY
jgi:hypothetical protein